MKNKQTKIKNIRHSLSHLLAIAVLKKIPDAKLGIGPIIENGFYYDFLLPRSLAPEDLKDFEKEIKKLISQKLPFTRKRITANEAKKIFRDQSFKLELIQEYIKEKKPLSIYKTGDIFIDLCAGGHVKNSGEINADAFKLTKLAGAYWRGNEKNPQLQRIYGVAFETKKELDGYLKMLEEAEKRDHRKLGKELDLFSVSEKVGPGLILWHPKLSLIREILETWWRQLHRQHGYQYVYTPHIGRAELWKTSGHLGFFRDSMYPPFTDIETKEEYFIKPMSCPFHVEIYKSRTRSYRDLPLRWNELGTCYRYEKSGELLGMARPRGFTQDDAHIICTQEQLKDEYRKVIELTLDMYKVFGFKKLKYYLSIRDPKNLKKYVGDSKVWNVAESTIRKILEEKNIKYEVEEGGAKFYGPALDIKIFDAIGREWQCPTIQLDMNLPVKFGMTYIGPNGKEHTPIMLHRTIFGAMERFCAILIEHFAGAFPLWLAPVQVKILPVGSRHENYAKKVCAEMMENNIRAEIDGANETIGKKIRNAELEKIPYILVVGDKEEKNNSVAVRERNKGNLGAMKLKKFIEKIQKEIGNKK